MSVCEVWEDSTSEDEQSEMVVQRGSPWDAQEESEIIAHIPIDYESCISYAQEKAGIQEGLCFDFNKTWAPYRWEDLEVGTRAAHLAVSEYNVMYVKEKYANHKLNPCPPCCCCNKAMHKEDFEPKVRKLIPFQKITDIEVHEAGSNELVSPPTVASVFYLVAFVAVLVLLVQWMRGEIPEGLVSESPAFLLVGGFLALSFFKPPFKCNFPPICNPVSMELPISKALISTAGSDGPELVIEGIKDANGFRRMVLDMKKKVSGFAPMQQGMSTEPAALGANSEVLSLLRDIAKSRREIAQKIQTKSPSEIAQLIQKK